LGAEGAAGCGGCGRVRQGAAGCGVVRRCGRCKGAAGGLSEAGMSFAVMTPHGSADSRRSRLLAALRRIPRPNKCASCYAPLQGTFQILRSASKRGRVHPGQYCGRVLPIHTSRNRPVLRHCSGFIGRIVDSAGIGEGSEPDLKRRVRGTATSRSESSGRNGELAELSAHNQGTHARQAFGHLSPPHHRAPRRTCRTVSPHLLRLVAPFRTLSHPSHPSAPCRTLSHPSAPRRPYSPPPLN
jgi:hypothetical protein